MSSKYRTFPIDLSSPPLITMMGNAVHGHRPIERYLIPTVWSLHLYNYDAELIVDKMRLQVCPGFAGITPPNSNAEYRMKGVGQHLYAHFVLPRSSGDRSIPAMQDAGPAFEVLYRNFELAIAIGESTPHRAQLIIWQILWSLVYLDADSRRHHPLTVPGQFVSLLSGHDLVRLTKDIIEERLSSNISVAAIAEQLQVSHNHLTRQFRAQIGMTVIGYIQHRRMEQAKMLLTGTGKPIKSIAAEVGIPDVQQFNKTVRRLLGRSPSEIRAGL